MHTATEHYFHKPEQVAEAVAEAVRIVDEAALPQNLRAVAFEKVLELLTSKQVFFEQIAPTGVLLGNGQR